MTLYNIAESLILEVASRNDLMHALQNHRIVELSYDDEEDPGGKGRRWVQMYCYGAVSYTHLTLPTNREV